MIVSILFCSLLSVDRPDLLIADFEGNDYGEWKTTGEAFGSAPARGTLPGQMPVSGFEGRGLVNTFLGGDGPVGTLTSPPFRIERDYIRFLIGGGGWENQTSLRLLVDGRIVRQSTGRQTDAGGTEELALTGWDVRDLAGQSAVIEILDQATGGWGHINVDNIAQTDRKPSSLLMPRERTMVINHRYLLLPIKNNAPRRKLTLSVPKQTLVSLEIELADGDPDWWAFVPVEDWRGQSLRMQVDQLAEDSRGLEQIEFSDQIRSQTPLYAEKHRPQFHFSSQRGWNNDPNGLSYFRGEYHLFYQHNPVGWNWGNMHWGHAVSKDLVHWEEVGDTLWPDRHGAMFSGSGVVDHANTSGLGEPNRPAHVLLYTAWGQPTRPDVQSIAYSTDGRSYTKYAGNPVLPQITPGNRDPKVFWHGPTNRWVMVLYVEEPKGTHLIEVLHSTNLKQWTSASRLPGFFECPDLFPLPLDGDRSRMKWVITAADSDYMVGSFDGVTFRPETPKLKGHRGRGFYAAQTFSDLPASDGRIIQMGWLQAPSPGMPFNQAMSLPLELGLVSTADGPRLTWKPVAELQKLRDRRVDRAQASQEGADLYEWEFVWEDGDAPIEFDCRGARGKIDPRRHELVLLDHRVTLPTTTARQHSLRVFGDRTTLELFLDDGQVYVPFPFIPDPNHRQVDIRPAKEGETKVLVDQLYMLRSAWDRP
jgi:sucrose-6-phosphate hydrolase SacC (GH32 family)